MKRVEYNEQEEQALLRLLDAGVRHLGLDGANQAAVWLAKLQKAEKVEEEETEIDL